jgi:hypothetical protein
MPSFMYHCPTLGLTEQGFVADEVGAQLGEDSFVSVYCVACSGVHLVNPISAKVIGADDEDES